MHVISFGGNTIVVIVMWECCDALVSAVTIGMESESIYTAVFWALD